MALVEPEAPVMLPFHISDYWLDWYLLGISVFSLAVQGHS